MVHTYCVDGTNLVRGAYGYGGPEFRRQEDADAERLVAALSMLCESLEGRLEVEVFFDGAFRDLKSGSRYLRVRFARDVQADELILDRVRGSQYAGSGRVTVVTGDGELGRTATDEGARWQRVTAGTSLESVLSAIERRIS